jgi:hypothetical protein
MGERRAVKTLAFVIALSIMAVGAIGIFTPSGLVWIARHSITAGELYFFAGFRVAFGVLLLSVASASRAPRTLRVVAFIPIAAGIATPFIGVEHAPAIIEWWAQQGSGVVRVTAGLVLALGGFLAYACTSDRRGGPIGNSSPE